MRKFPMFIDIENKLAVIVGGGKIALRRAQTLVKFGCDVKIIAPKCEKELFAIKGVEVIQREYCTGDCKGAFIVVGATDNATVNERVVKEGRALGAYVNASHKKELCDFYFPGVVTKGENIVIGVSASGSDHKGAKEMRKKIASLIGGEDEL